MTIVAGISGAVHNAAVCLCRDGRVAAFCEQERVTRIRSIGFRPGTLPAEALAATLSCLPAVESSVSRYVTAEPVALPEGVPSAQVDHHHAHAAAAYGLSTFADAAVLVCDGRAADSLTVWTARDGRMRRHPWAATSHGFAALYAEAARLFGFPDGREHELEALARLAPGEEADRFASTISYRDGTLRVDPGWRTALGDWLGGSAVTSLEHRARVASAFQRHLAALLVRVAEDVRRETGFSRLCLGGGLFYNTSFTTAIRQSDAFDDVFTIPNPGRAGTAIGAALLGAHELEPGPVSIVSPFLGPAYDAEVIKRTLDNCKVAYEYVGDTEVLDIAAGALARGELVGWFQGRMEWGHRALGNRSILASPVSPHVLDNLNLYLKQRPRYRAYGVSVPVEAAPGLFDGPPTSSFMEYEYHPRDRERFSALMPDGTRTLRVQTVGRDPIDPASGRFWRLHDRFGQITGLPVLVNTSFNGFSEPMVCSPRDAIRVFFGTGLDLLVMDRFVVRK